MVNHTKDKSPADIKAMGYRDIGIYIKGEKDLSDLIFNATIKGKIDIVLLELRDTDKMYMAFSKAM